LRAGFQIVLFMLCLNLASGLYYQLGIAGSSYSNPLTGTGNSSDYSSRFDPDKVMNQTQPNISMGLPFLEQTYGALMTLWNSISFIIIGFPQLLWQFGGLISDPTARLGYQAIIGCIGAVESFVIGLWLYQLITGRQVQD